jgi:multidrug transporter EmrE-like cation transporter
MNAQPHHWFRLMLIAFVANGIGPFGLKVLAELHLGRYQYQYLIFWYGGGLALAITTFRFGHPFLRWELLIGASMGLCSLAGQYLVGRALAEGVPGHVVFPVTTGGTLFLVALSGILVFKEDVGPYGRAGLVLGILALVVLSFG